MSSRDMINKRSMAVPPPPSLVYSKIIGRDDCNSVHSHHLSCLPQTFLDFQLFLFQCLQLLSFRSIVRNSYLIEAVVKVYQHC